MPSNAKRNAKRNARKRAEEAQNDVARKAPKSAYAESVTDEEETERKDAKSETDKGESKGKNAKSATDEEESRKNAEIDAFLRTVPTGPSNGTDTQHQSNRVAPESILQEKEATTKDPPCPRHKIYDEVMKGLEKISEEEVERLRNVLLEHVNKEGFPIEFPALPSRYTPYVSTQGTNGNTLSTALMGIPIQKPRAVPIPVTLTAGTFDGASMSVEIVDADEETPDGSAMSAGDGDDQGEKAYVMGPQKMDPGTVTSSIPPIPVALLHASDEKFLSKEHPFQGKTTLYHGKENSDSSPDDTTSSSEPESRRNLRRAQPVANDDILEMKASPIKTDASLAIGDAHRRKVSLKLPVNVSKPHLGHTRDPFQRSNTTSVGAGEANPPSFEAEQQDLEYQHRHTFVGSASLDEFLENLEVTATYTTTRRNVIKAFGILACEEQLQARQSSISSEGWSYVTRVTHDDVLNRTDHLNESHIKLGSITLGKFLAMIMFDEKAETNAIKVVDAFCIASHLDAEATRESRSKAKAFRSWLIKEKAAKDTA